MRKIGKTSTAERSDDAQAHSPVEAPHALTAADCLEALHSSPKGLAAPEAAARLARYGRNALPHAEPPGVLVVFLHQFRSPLIYILLLAAAVAFALGDVSDAGFILVVLLLNALIGTFQEHRAERSAAALRALVRARAQVVRAGEEKEIDAEELVPGDVVVVESGSKVPADLRLLAGSGLEADESLLTGESLPVAKRSAVDLAADTTVGDRQNMLFAGTLIARGRGSGLVVATGLGTQIGHIARAIVETQAAKPPLLVRMELFTKKIALSVAGAVVLLGGVSFAQGATPQDVFLLAVALAVSVIPEGLPVALTVALSIAVRRMSRRNVIVRKLTAVEALGSCTFIASDKTGTLTMNELTVRRILLPDSPAWEVTGEGIVPDGAILIPTEDAEVARPRLTRLCEAIVLCNDATLTKRDESWTGQGDSVDLALLVLAEKAGISRANMASTHPRLDAMPFEAERQYAASLNRHPDGPRVAVKGAGERVLDMCVSMLGPDGEMPIDQEVLERETHALAAAGYRVLAVADGRGPTRGNLEPADLTELVFLGFVAMIDPLRPEARAAVHACRQAGIEVAMVTGDHPVTALAIASELGMAHRPEQVVAGPALRRAAERGASDFDALVRAGRVFARVEPQQKLEIVASLIRLGHFVAVTGDGANDAPALRTAHIGVAMGKRGTDVARETAQIILTDDNFASIVAGIEEGRVAYGNVRKVIFLLVSAGAAELLLFVLAAAAGTPLPLLPAQLLWLNLVTNGIQDVALAFEPAEGGELERPPRPPKQPIFDRLMIERTLISAAVIGGFGFGTFQLMLASGWELEAARNGLLLLLVLFENVQAGNARSETRSLFRLSPLRNPILFLGTVAAQLVHIAAMSLPGLRDVLRVSPVTLEQWTASLALALTLLLAIEAHKLFRAGRRPFGPSPVGRVSSSPAQPTSKEAR